MPNESVTKAQLVGTGGTMSFVGQEEPVDGQDFAFSGIDGAYRTSLGSRGTTYAVRGQLRATGADYAATGLALTAQITFITTRHRAGTVIDLFDGETTNIEKLYRDTLVAKMSNLVIQGFRVAGPRNYHVGGTIATVDYEMTLRRVGPV